MQHLDLKSGEISQIWFLQQKVRHLMERLVLMLAILFLCE